MLADVSAPGSAGLRPAASREACESSGEDFHDSHASRLVAGRRPALPDSLNQVALLMTQLVRILAGRKSHLQISPTWPTLGRVIPKAILIPHVIADRDQHVADIPGCRKANQTPVASANFVSNARQRWSNGDRSFGRERIPTVYTVA